jgi:Tfp pilus assembly protein PilE
MKATFGAQVGFTRLEMFVVCAVITILVGMGWMAVSGPRKYVRRISCVSNLKEIATANRIFVNDHNGLFAAQISTNHNGIMEFSSRGEAYKQFQILSNELGSPKVLVCPQDSRSSASNFSALNNSHLSYFAGLDVSDKYPSGFLAGDRSLTVNGASYATAVVRVRTNDVVAWTPALHESEGYVAFADGSVLWLTTAKVNDLVRQSETAQRLSFP